MNFNYIKSDEALEALNCLVVQSDRPISLDTEFIRVDSYYQKLGLIQINIEHGNFLIDPLTITNWDSFCSLLKCSNQFYFHACGEDIELINHYFKMIPEHIVDSQIFASFLDNPLSSSYQFLLEKYLSINIEKSETRTDWLARPLTEKQLQYAAVDVNYLPDLIEILKNELSQNGWLNEAYQETQSFITRRLSKKNSEDSYLNVKNAWKLNETQLSYLKLLSKWRLDTAISEDRAINFVLKDEQMINLVTTHPTSKASFEYCGLKGKEIRLYGDSILHLLNQKVEPIPKIKRTMDFPDYKLWVKEIKFLAESAEKITGLNKSLIISKRLINEFVEWKHNQDLPPPELLTGWRRELFLPLYEKL